MAAPSGGQRAVGRTLLRALCHPPASLASVLRRPSVHTDSGARCAAAGAAPRPGAAEQLAARNAPRVALVPPSPPPPPPVTAAARLNSTLLSSKPPLPHPREALCFVYKKHGKPLDVLHPVVEPLPQLRADWVIIQFLACPVNPADLNMVEGTYPMQAPPEAVTEQGTVAGGEGVAKVVAVGSTVACDFLEPGDWVIPRVPCFGTWRTYACVPAKMLQKLPKSGRLTVPQAATLAINPCTAYRLLKDFVALRPGDCVIQNGANSGVGQAVIQLAKAWGLRTVNIIRRPSQEDVGEHPRPSFEETSAYLQSLGATHVIAQDDLLNPEIKELFRTLEDPPNLGLNCVGGKQAADMARYLRPGGTLVTYGAMARQPIPVPASLLIFGDLIFRGFWLSRWVTHYRANHREPTHHHRTPPEPLDHMLHELANLACAGGLREPRWEPHYVNPPSVEKETDNNAMTIDEKWMGVERRFRRGVSKSGTGGVKHLLVFKPEVV